MVCISVDGVIQSQTLKLYNGVSSFDIATKVRSQIVS